jgi:glucans biosynthesis protein
MSLPDFLAEEPRSHKSIAVPVSQGPSRPSHPRRRDMLAYIGVSIAGLAYAPAVWGQTPPASAFARLGNNQRFDAAVVVDIARQLSKRPFAAPANDLPDAFANLNYDQYITIKSLRPPIWSTEGRGIAVEPLHRGFVFSNAVDLFLVEDGNVRRVGYDPTQFNFGGINVPNNIPDLGFSGFRLISQQGDTQAFDFAIIQGATFFRALARGQNYGAISRALTLKPADAKGEEFPTFRAFWIERPGIGSNSITIHGVMDSESTTGAVRMTFRPGDMTIVDVETTLFPRVNLDHVGLGAIASTYFYGPNDRRTADDIRPAVYESSGLQMLNGQGEWLWRPLHNPETLQISAFVDNSPKGFGLLQRERAYEAFQDDDQRFERRPSLWIEPLGDWGEGSVQLLEIPTDAEINDNILTYWRPKTPMAAGSEVPFAYRQYWGWNSPERPPLATVTATRVGRGTGGRRRKFTIDFSGDMLGDNWPKDLKSVLTVGPGTFQNLKLLPYPERKTVRVAFELDPGNENACEMRLILEAGGKPISETWLYRWTP